jgi:hypothetical protein
LISRTFRIITTLATLLMVGGALHAPVTATAQFSPEDMLKTLDGIETAYSRKYIAEAELGFGSPEAPAPSTPEVLTATVLEFDNEQHAADAFDSVKNPLIAREIMLGHGDLDVDDADIDDLGDQARLFIGATDAHHEPETSAMLIVQDGNLGYLIQATGPDPAIEQTLMSFGAFMVDAEPGTGPVVPGEYADTRGGTFDLLPTREDTDVLRGLVPMYDYDLLLSQKPIDHPATPEEHEHHG